MITVGIGNLKNSLSQYLNMVKSGQRVLVTDHDKIIAEIIPSSGITEKNEIITKYINEQVINGSITKTKKKKEIITIKKGNGKENEQIKKIYEETRSERI